MAGILWRCADPALPLRRRACRPRPRALSRAAALRRPLDRFPRRGLPGAHPGERHAGADVRPDRLSSTRAPADAFVLVMTHEHSLDLAITAAALQREFPYVGLIGSATKRARFEKRFREVGDPGGAHPLARLPDRPCRHRRQGARDHRRVRRRATAAGAGPRDEGGIVCSRKGQGGTAVPSEGTWLY